MMLRDGDIESCNITLDRNPILRIQILEEGRSQRPARELITFLQLLRFIENGDTRPKVIPAASIPTPASATAANFRIFDAVRDENKQKEKEDEEMANFLPMLQEYLSSLCFTRIFVS